jgi:hypothetical protein
MSLAELAGGWVVAEGQHYCVVAEVSIARRRGEPLDVMPVWVESLDSLRSPLVIAGLATGKKRQGTPL